MEIQELITVFSKQLSSLENMQKISTIISAIAVSASATVACFSAWISYSMRRIAKQQQELSRKIIKTEHENAITNMINDVNKTVLSADENIKAYLITHLLPADILDETENIDVHKARRLWITFLELNYLEVTYLNMDRGLVDKEFAEPILDKILTPHLRKKDSYDMIMSAAYTEKFKNYCKSKKVG